MSNRITIDPKVCHGQACIKGTRIPVHQILRMFANGDTIEDLLQEYPSVHGKISSPASTMQRPWLKSR